MWNAAWKQRKPSKPHARWHGVDTRSSTTQNARRYANYVEHALQNVVVVPRPPAQGYTAVKAALFQPDTKLEMIRPDTGSTTTFIDRSLVDKALIRQTPPITAKGFFKEQILDQLVELPIYILTSSSSSLKIYTVAYLVDNLRAGVLLGTDTLMKEGASIDLKRKKLTIQDVTADIVFKTPKSPTRMHITVRPPMHEVLRQRRLDYAAVSSQFRAKSQLSYYTPKRPTG